MTEQTGWAEDETQPPHRLLRTSLGTLTPAAITETTVGGRPVLVFTGTDQSALPLAVVDLASGELLPDRSLLHGEYVRKIGLGRGHGRTVLVTAAPSGRTGVREADTGEPVCAALDGPEHPRAVQASVIGGREIVAVTSEAEAHAWDVADGARVAKHDFGGETLVAHDGRLLTVAGDETSWQLRDVLTGETYGAAFPAHGDLVEAVVCAGRVLVASQLHRRGPATPVRVWDVLAGAEIEVAPLWRAEEVEVYPPYPLLGVEVPQPWLARLALAELDGGLAAMVTWTALDHGSRVELWLPGADGPRRVPLPEAGRDAEVTFLPDGERLLVAFGGKDGALAVHDITSGTELRSLYYGGPIGPFAGLATRDGRTLAVFSGPRAVVYDLESGRLVAEPPPAPDGPRATVVAKVGGDGFRVRDTTTGETLMEIDGFRGREIGRVTAAAAGEVDGRLLVAVGTDTAAVHVWEVATGEPVGTSWQFARGDRITAVALSRWRDQPVVLTAGRRGLPRMWMLDAPVRGAGHTGPVRAVAGGLRGGRPVFASGGDDGTIRFWDPVTGRTIGEPIEAGAVSGLVFAGEVLVSGGGGLVRRWDPATGAERGEPLWSADPRGRVAATTLDGRALTGISTGDHLRIWDAATGEPHTVMPFPQPESLEDLDVRDGRLVAITVGAPDEERFADHAGEYDRQITIWDVPAAAPLFPPMLTCEDGEHGAFGRVAGRLVSAQGVDGMKYGEDDCEGVPPEEESDITLRDLTTGELYADYQHQAGFNAQLLFTRHRGRDLLLMATDQTVTMCDAATAEGLGHDINGLLGHVTGVAAVEWEDRTFGAAGDWNGGVQIWEIDPD